MDPAKLKKLYADDPVMLGVIEQREQTTLLKSMAEKMGEKSKVQIDGAVLKGDKGDKGDPGESVAGPEGPQGPQGEKGDSVVGPAGRNGEDGKSITGPAGKDGKDGRDGKDADLVSIDEEKIAELVIDTVKKNQLLDTSHIKGLQSFIKDGISYKVEELMHGGGGSSSGGDVSGPSSAIENSIALYSDTTGKLIKDSFLVVTSDGVDSTTIKVADQTLPDTHGRSLVITGSDANGNAAGGNMLYAAGNGDTAGGEISFSAGIVLVEGQGSDVGFSASSANGSGDNKGGDFNIRLGGSTGAALAGRVIVFPNGMGDPAKLIFDSSGNQSYTFPANTGTVALTSDITIPTALANSSITPVSDGTYTVGSKITPVSGTDGTITVQNGIITAIQEAT